jgi:dTMP kinase
LQESLKAARITQTSFDFPNYETTIAGKLIGECLNGEHGDFLALDPYLASALYALDRASVLSHINEALKKGVVLTNRYVVSNLMYQGAKIDDPKKRATYIQQWERLEYDELGLPRPTLVFYLDVPTHIATDLVTKKALRKHVSGGTGAKDVFESNLSYQEKVTQLYRSCATTRKDWRRIVCVDKEGKMLSPEAIHQLVLAEVRTFLS